jgi:tetratricopeptide (TPR) repeat protein
LRLTAALMWFYECRGHLSEGRTRFEEALRRHAGLNGALEHPRAIQLLLARILCGAGAMAWQQGDSQAARRRLEQSYQLAEMLGATRIMAETADFLGLVAQYSGDQVSAGAWYRRTIALARESGHHWILADALTLLGDSLPAQQSAEAERLYLESLALLRANRDPWAALPLVSLSRLALQRGAYTEAQALLGEAVELRRVEGSGLLLAIALSASGEAARFVRDLDLAERLFTESLALSRKGGFKASTAWALCGLGSIAVARCDARAAEVMLKEALLMAADLGQSQRTAACLLGLAGVAQADGDFEASAEWLGAAHAMYGRDGGSLEPADKLESARYLAVAKTSLSRARFRAAWSRGQENQDSLVAQALGGTSGPHRLPY